MPNKDRRLTNMEKLEGIEFAISEIPEQYLCAYTKLIMDDPVYAEGNTLRFDRIPLETWLNFSATCPVSNKPLQATSLNPDLDLKNQIEKFVMQEENTYLINRSKRLLQEARARLKAAEQAQQPEPLVITGGRYMLVSSLRTKLTLAQANVKKALGPMEELQSETVVELKRLLTNAQIRLQEAKQVPEPLHIMRGRYKLIARLQMKITLAEANVQEAQEPEQTPMKEVQPDVTKPHKKLSV